MAVPIIALLTDFGLRDHYVGAMKGAILSVRPDATLVDIVHDLPAHDVEAGALALAAACPAFPRGTVFVAVVDPGVGSDRRGLAGAAGDWTFVAPDNGLLTVVWDEQGPGPVHAIENEALVRPGVSATFHGRDVFGPVAAHLAGGLHLSAVGPPVALPVRLDLPAVETTGAACIGTTLAVDRFGNLVTNIGARELVGILGAVGDDPTELVVEVEGAVLPLVRTYAEVPEGEACALVGSSGRLEVAVREGSASRLLGAARGARVRVRRAGPRGAGVL